MYDIVIHIQNLYQLYGSLNAEVGFFIFIKLVVLKNKLFYK